MAATDLTSVERGALLVLMAAGRPLREASELREVHGIHLTPSHREKLQSLGFIHTTTRPLIHALSEKGWQWVWEEAAAPKPKGNIGLNALHAVLQGVRRYVDGRGNRLEEVFGRAPPSDDPGAMRRRKSSSVSVSSATLSVAASSPCGNRLVY